MAANSNPKWLEPLWERKKSETAKRVEQAVKEMVKQSEPVTLDGIRHTVKALFGISISANTIQRNEGAHAAYQKHRTAREVIRSGESGHCDDAAEAFQWQTRSTSERRSTDCGANRKTSLIARLLQLESRTKASS